MTLPDNHSPKSYCCAARLSRVATLLAVWACCACLLDCGDSFSKFPVHAVANINPRDSARIVDLSHVYYDAVTSASLRVDSAFVSATTCTLYLFMRYANGSTWVMLSKRPIKYYQLDTTDTITKGLDPNAQNVHLMYVFQNLRPKTLYYFDLHGEWYFEDGRTLRNWWGLDSLTFTTTDTIP
jgi:hypothetical protein